MRIAIVLDNIYLAEIKSNIKKIMLLEADDELVTAIDEDIILISDTNYLSLWLLARQVVRLYCDGLTDSGKIFLENAGITIYPLKQIRNHPILQALLIKDEKENS